MTQLFSNQARALLTAGILAADTSLSIETAKAGLFPIANTGTGSVPATATDWFKAVLQDSAGNVEIVYVRTRASNSAVLSNVIRAREGTTARDFAAGSVCGLRMTASDYLDSNATIALREVAANKDASGGYPGLTLFRLNLRNAANTFTSFLTNAATAVRTWTLPDKDGTVALLSDITDNPIRLNPRNITANIAIPSAYNAASVGPITIQDGITVTVGDNATYAIQ